MAPQIDFEKIVGGLLLGAGVGVGLALVNRLLKPLLPTPPQKGELPPVSVLVVNPRTGEVITRLPSTAALRIPITAIRRSPALELSTLKSPEEIGGIKSL